VTNGTRIDAISIMHPRRDGYITSYSFTARGSDLQPDILTRFIDTYVRIPVRAVSDEDNLPVRYAYAQRQVLGYERARACWVRFDRVWAGRILDDAERPANRRPHSSRKSNRTNHNPSAMFGTLFRSAELNSRLTLGPNANRRKAPGPNG